MSMIAVILSATAAVSAAHFLPGTGDQRDGFSIQAIKVPPPNDVGHAHMHARADGQDTVSVGSQWYLPVQIGTPAQSFLMTPDTGAPSLAVRSVFLPPNETSDNASAYDPAKSTTATQLHGYTYSNCFVSGHCGSGVVYNDTVTVGNISVPMAFEVSQHNNGVSNGPTIGGGNFGLNLAKTMTTSPQRVPSWLQTVLPLLNDQLFAIDFDEASSSGTFDFGFTNDSKHNGDIAYTPVNSTTGSWSIVFSGFQIGINGTFNESQSWNVVVDSGTVSSHLPKFVVDAYFQHIQDATYDSGSSKYRFPCSTMLPDFVFGIAGNSTYRGHIPLKGTSIGNGMCDTKLIASTADSVIFGQTFIESQFVVFDFGRKRVGFANKGTSGTNVSQTSSSGGNNSTSAATAFHKRHGWSCGAHWILFYVVLMFVVI